MSNIRLIPDSSGHNYTIVVEEAITPELCQLDADDSIYVCLLVLFVRQGSQQPHLHGFPNVHENEVHLRPVHSRSTAIETNSPVNRTG